MSSVLFFGCARQRAGGGEVEEGERGARARGALTAAPSFDPARAANTARSAIRMYLPIVLVRGVISRTPPKTFLLNLGSLCLMKAEEEI